MGTNVATMIQDTTRDFLNDGGSLMGQCITAVGWIQGTVPSDAPNLVELPMNDVSGPGFAIGSALSGTPTILVLRFQSLLWLASSTLANYAAKCRAVWDQDCPLLVRCIAGEHTGPIHTNCNHHLFMPVPGIRIACPMTPGEIRKEWDIFMSSRDPVLWSEHRTSYKNTEELNDLRYASAVKVTTFPCSASRFSAQAASRELCKEGIYADVRHIRVLRPFVPSADDVHRLRRSGRGLVLDSSYENGGVVENIAYRLQRASGVPVDVMGQGETPSASMERYKGTPTVGDIVRYVRGL